MVEGARLESVFRGNSNVGSNPTLSASLGVDLWNLTKISVSTNNHVGLNDLNSMGILLSEAQGPAGSYLRLQSTLLIPGSSPSQGDTIITMPEGWAPLQ